MTSDLRTGLRLLVDDGVRHAIRETGRNPLATKAAVEDDLEARRFSTVPLQIQGKHAAVFTAYIEYEGIPLD